MANSIKVDFSGLNKAMMGQQGINAQQQSIFDNLQKSLTKPAPVINMDDPASLKAAAAKAQQDGDMQEAVRLHKMAIETEDRQKKGADENVLRSYEQVKGTPQEAQFKQAMKEAGKGDIIRAAETKDMAFRSASLRLEDQEAESGSRRFMMGYARAVAQGDMEAAAGIEQQANDAGLGMHIEEFKRNKTLKSRADRDDALKVAKQQEEQVEKQVYKLPIPENTGARQALIKRAEEMGQGDLYRARIKAFDDYMSGQSEMQSNIDLSQRRFTKEEVELAGIDYKAYEAGVSQTPMEMNKAVIKGLASKEAVDTTDEDGNEAPSKAYIEHWQGWIEDEFQDGDLLWVDSSEDKAIQEGNSAARDAAVLFKAGMPTAEIEEYLHWRHANPDIPTWVENNKIYPELEE